MKLSFSIYFIIVFYVTGSLSRLSCMDENNSPVDWFIALKYPHNYYFVYMTPDILNWKVSSKDLSSSDNMIALTLRQSYDQKFFYVFYNDQSPDYNEFINLLYSTRGHLKGVLNFDQSGGYWLIHSVPKFPSPGEYVYMKGEERFGQSFICVSVDFDNLSQIVKQLLIMQSTVYASNIPTDFSSDTSLMNDIISLVNNDHVPTSSSNNLALTTSNKVSLIHFAKSRDFGADLYGGLIAPSLKASLFVETWIRQDRLDSSCKTEFKVYNVDYVNLNGDQFKETMDHSKWAVSTSSDQPYVCIGDINRMSSQFARGGGSMCLSNIDIWNKFKDLVAKYEKCDEDE